MADSRDSSGRNHPPHDALLLSKVISEKKQIRITFLDGDTLIDGLRWHTSESLGMRDGKVVNRSSVKFWEVVD